MKGCGAYPCGFCGPRLADDWSRALIAAEPNLELILPIRECSGWTDLRTRVNRLTAVLRRAYGGAEAAWWVERASSGTTNVRYVARVVGLEDVSKATEVMGRFPGAVMSVRPDEEIDRGLWLVTRRLLENLSDQVYAPTYSSAATAMEEHLALNGPGPSSAELVHTSDGFFGIKSGEPVRRSDALRAVSLWRNRPGGPIEASHGTVGPGQKWQPDPVWHDATWRAVESAFPRRIVDEYEELPNSAPANDPEAQEEWEEALGQADDHGVDADDPAHELELDEWDWRQLLEGLTF